MKDIVQKISEIVERDREEIVNFIRDFIAIESVTYQEQAAIDFLAAKMKNFGYDEVRIDAVGNVLGRVGSGKTVVVYDAHIDTVEPGDAKDWGFDPLKGKYENGIIYGRGAVDDKGCLGGLAYAGKILKELALSGDFTLWVSGSLAEEDVEGSAVNEMLKVNADIKPDYILVGEASGLRIVRGHKGRAMVKVTVPGKHAHASSAYKGINSLAKALPILDGIDKMNNFSEDEFLGKGTFEITSCVSETLSLNTIPGKTVLHADRRISCGESISDILGEIKEWTDEANAVAEIGEERYKTYTGYEVVAEDYFPSWVMPMDSKIVQAGIETFKTLFEKEPVVGRWDFCTNATSLCGRTGIPALGFGPGDESLCHSLDDQLPVSELLQAIKFYTLFPLIVSK